MSNVMLRKPSGILRWIRLYRLYLEAFPPAERKPFMTIVRMYRRGGTDVWCLEWEGRFVGLATTVNGDNLILLDYFAVVKSRRGQGIGAAAMARLQHIYEDRGLFVEIESTRKGSPNQAEREKRKRFYQAAGMEPLGVYVSVFDVDMELLGSRCDLDFQGYRAFYRDHYSPWAAEHLTESEL